MAQNMCGGVFITRGVTIIIWDNEGLPKPATPTIHNESRQAVLEMPPVLGRGILLWPRA